MASNLERYKKDLEKLLHNGALLLNSINKRYHPEQYKEFTEAELKRLPIFQVSYQTWYSESLAVIKQLIPDRKNDFIKLYEKPKNRGKVNIDNYSIEDCLKGLTIGTVIGPKVAIPLFQQQLEILRSAQQRFESSLFDIKQLLQADLFDSELDAATELNKKGFVRGAGAIAGVVLEGHLLQVCGNHKIKVTKKNPTISDLNQMLKDKGVIDTPMWRNIQRLADLRNLCDHKRQPEPTKEKVKELIEGVEKTIKILF